MDKNKILNSFDIFDNYGGIEKCHHLLESKFEKYENTINVNIGSFKYPNYVTRKVPGIADNSIYLIEEDDDFRLIYDKGIAMFDLTIRRGILVSESIKLSSSLTRNKEDLTRVIELLIHKLNEPSRNNSSSF
jgi:hypothetical protein